MPIKAASVEERFWRFVFADMNAGCWLWSGAVMKNGYGVLGSEGLAHRVSYQIFRGHIQDGMTIDHLCRVRCCVNPNHLEVVTRAENVRRGTRHDLKKTCIRGHVMEGENLIYEKAGRRCRACHKIHAKICCERSKNAH